MKLKKLIDLSMLPNVEKPKVEPYRAKPDRTSRKELNKIMYAHGFVIPDDGTWFGGWTTNKDGSISLSVDGNIVLFPINAQHKTESKP